MVDITSTFPAALVPAIQQGYLEREFRDGLQSVNGYRQAAAREPFMVNVGETITKTRAGLLAPTTTPINPSQLSNDFDNGLTGQNWTIEQYTLTLQLYGASMNLNLITQKIGIADRFLRNSRALGIQSSQSMDFLARDAVFNAYLSGNTRVTTTLGSAGPTVRVDDLRGFMQVPGAGPAGTLPNGAPNAGQNPSPTMLPVSSSNPLTVTIGVNQYSVVGFLADANNVSTAPLGISGTITCSGNVTVADGTIGNTVQSGYASTIYRPNGRTNTSMLTNGDTLTAQNLIDGVTRLRRNGVPGIDGRYNCYTDPGSTRQLFSDPEWQLLYRGAETSNETYKNLTIADTLGLRFIDTTNVYNSAAPGLAGFNVGRVIILGEEALIEGDFAGQDSDDVGNPVAIMYDVEGVKHIVRAPLDRFQGNVAQSWRWIGGFCAPTDVTANKTIIPTASNALYKRGVVIEHIMPTT
jgi:hypothetical protein